MITDYNNSYNVFINIASTGMYFWWASKIKFYLNYSTFILGLGPDKDRSPRENVLSYKMERIRRRKQKYPLITCLPGIKVIVYKSYGGLFYETEYKIYAGLGQFKGQLISKRFFWVVENERKHVAY